MLSTKRETARRRLPRQRQGRRLAARASSSACPTPSTTGTASSKRARGPLRAGVHGRERRRPRADRRDLAVRAVQAPVAERVLGLHQLVDLRRALVDDRRARVAEVALDPDLARCSRTSRTPGSRGARPRTPTRSRATSRARSRGSSAGPRSSSTRPASRAASTSRSRAPSSRSCPGRTGNGRSPARTSRARVRTRPTARGRRARRRSAPAATVNRPWSSECIAISNPWPSSPIRFSAGTSTFSKKSSPVEPAQIPSLSSWSRVVKPGIPFSSTKAVIPLWPASGSVFAKTSAWSATDRVRDPVLLAVQDVDVALAPRRRAHRRDVGAGARLGQPEARELLALRLRHEPALLLLLRPVPRGARASSARRGPRSACGRRPRRARSPRRRAPRQTKSSPAPPYSSGITIPRIPSSAIPSIRSRSSWCAMSFSTATGSTRSSTNARTVSCSSRCSAVRSKSIGPVA